MVAARTGQATTIFYHLAIVLPEADSLSYLATMLSPAPIWVLFLQEQWVLAWREYAPFRFLVARRAPLCPKRQQVISQFMFIQTFLASVFQFYRGYGFYSAQGA